MYKNLEHPLKQKHLMMIMPQSFSSSQKRKIHGKKMKMKIKVHKALARRKKFSLREIRMLFVLTLSKVCMYMCETLKKDMKTFKSRWFSCAFIIRTQTFKWCFRTIFISVSRRIHNDQHLKKYPGKVVRSEYKFFLFRSMSSREKSGYYKLISRQ